MIILGIDPGTATTGYGIIKTSKSSIGKLYRGQNFLECINYGCIKTDSSLPAAERLKKIHNEVSRLIKTYKPGLVAIESLYFFKNVKTAIPVSQARGVLLLAASQNKIKIAEFTPLQIKSAIVGYGNAEKTQVQRMIMTTLNLQGLPRPDDAADALGAAICAAYLMR